MNQLTISAQANFGITEVKARSAGRSQNIVRARETSMNQLTISAQANFGITEVKARSAGRSQNIVRAREASMKFPAAASGHAHADFGQKSRGSRVTLVMHMTSRGES